MRPTSFIRVISFIALVLCLSTPAWSQRKATGNTLTSDSLPKAILQIDSAFTYLGTQSFILYDVATAEQHFFAELDGKRVKRYVWVQYEGYLPDKNHTYDYSRDSTSTIWGREVYRRSQIRQIPATDDNPASDGARARQFLRERGLTLGPTVLYHRLVWLFETPARHELMIIYMEDPGASLEALAGAQVSELIRASLARAERSISLR